MKLHLEVNNIRVNLEATKTFGDETAVLAKLRSLLYELAGFENVALSVNSYASPVEEVPASIDLSVNPQAAWPFPTETYEDLPLVDDDIVEQEVPVELVSEEQQ